jgi:hypothetical protein
MIAVPCASRIFAWRLMGSGSPGPSGNRLLSFVERRVSWRS